MPPSSDHGGSDLAAPTPDGAVFAAAFRTSRGVMALTTARDGRYLEVSDGFAEVTGYERREVVGRTSLELRLFADPERRDEIVRRIRETGHARDVEARVRTKSGDVLLGRFDIDLVEAGDEPLLLTQMTDVTEQARIERDLRIKSRAIESAVFGVGMTDLEGRLTYANAAALRMWGFDDLGEILGRPLPELWAGDGVLQTLAVLRRGGGRTGEDIGKRKDGSTFPVLFSASVIEDASGRPLCTFGTFVDLTDQKRAEQARRALEARMSQAQKLESLGDLAGGVAHDLNNLLVGILGNAELAAAEIPSGTIAGDCLADVVAAALRAADLSKQMLAYSGKGKLEVTSVDLRRLVEEMARLLDAAISKKAILKLDFGADPSIVRADAAQMRQVVLNLITNASEAVGDAGGVITLRTGAQHCDRSYLNGAFLGHESPEGRYVFFEVRDTATGMDEQTAARMFDPFFTTKLPGRGLGLAVVLGIVRGHGGAVRVDTAPGRGTCVRVLLPAATAAIEGPRPRPGDRRTRKVLLVDDESAVRKVGARMLERLGLEVVTASDGRKAVSAFEADPEGFDCVVLDVSMPVMDGEECLRELQRLRPDVRVLLSSGYDEQTVAHRFSGRSVARFVHKPFRMAQLSEEVGRILGVPLAERS